MVATCPRNPDHAGGMAAACGSPVARNPTSPAHAGTTCTRKSRCQRASTLIATTAIPHPTSTTTLLTMAMRSAPGEVEIPAAPMRRVLLGCTGSGATGVRQGKASSSLPPHWLRCHPRSMRTWGCSSTALESTSKTKLCSARARHGVRRRLGVRGRDKTPWLWLWLGGWQGALPRGT